MKKLFISLAALVACATTWSQCVITLNTPGNLTNECAGPQGTLVNFSVTATSSCGGSVAVSCNPTSGSLFSLGTTTVNCFAQDLEHHFASASFTVTVRDTSPPLINHPPLVNAPCSGPSGAYVNYDVTASDACSTNVTLNCSPLSGSFFPVGTTLVTCKAMDGASNVSVAVFPVTVSGGCANCIELYCPNPIVLNTGPAGTASTNFIVTATNTCVRNMPLEVTCEPPPNSALPVGTNIIHCSVTDGAGSFQECEFPIIVVDNVPPYLSVKPLVEVECKGFSPSGVPGAQVWFPPATVTDNADPKPTATFAPANGSNFPIGSHTVTCTATDHSGNQTAKTFVVVVKPGPKCDLNADPEMTLAPDNWGFELGNLTGWAETGNAFSDQPLLGDRITVKRIDWLSQQMSNSIGGDYWRDVTFQIGFKGKFWVGTGDSPPDIFSTDTGGPANQARTGTLVSKQFTVEKNYITFLIGGQEDFNNLRVEFLVQTNAGPNTVHIGSYDYFIVAFKTGHGSEELRREDFPVQSWIGRQARIRIVDNSTNGHLNVDDFTFQDSAPLATFVNVAGTNIPSVNFVDGKFYDWDAPLWGFADMHTHPMSYLGFGGKIMHGQLDGHIYDALGDCNCDHGGYDLVENQCGDYYRQLLTSVMDDKGYSPHRAGYVFDGWKNFRNWPVFTTITHQQMWYDWMKRTYDGGERVIVALCVNAQLLARVSKGHLPYDDLWVSTNQIAEMKAFVARHSDFMEIAYNPFQMREIVRGNRMAVILGSELDDIGNLCGDAMVHESADTFSKLRVKTEIDRLYNLGVRYIFPVHLEDNKFGGTAIAGDMLNIGNKYLNGVPFDAEHSPESEGLSLALEKHLDYTGEAVGLNIAAVAFGPLLPNVASPIIEAFMGPQEPGSGVAVSFGILPIALFGVANELVLNAIGVEPLPTSLWPVGNNYPDYGTPSWGHRNARGLTPLGEYAVREFMKRGIMLDIDHMSYHTITNVLARAEAVPGGYPLNSGHNSFRLIQIEPGENSRTPEQLIRIRDLGGIMGVGYENGDTHSRHIGLDEPSPAASEVENNCAGTSKSFAQNYLYALERLGGKQIALGTDVNGMIPGPGPRFGPQSAFGLEVQPEARHIDQIGDQRNGVLYAPKYGRPLTTPAFIGSGMDPDKTEDKPRADKGYRYNKEQAAYFAALRIFFWNRHISEDDLNKIVDAMHDSYPDKGRIKELTRGLKKANVGDNGGSDTEKIAGAVLRRQELDIPCSDEIVNDSNKYARYGRLSRVWHDYQHNFGNNTPMKHCITSFKEWDYNFEGMAHYGLVPDFLQDLSNVNLLPVDMSPLFQSAEDFAQMWAKSLTAAYNITHPLLHIFADPTNHTVVTVQWYGEDGDVVEESTNLNSGVWQPCAAPVQTVNGQKQIVIQMNPNTPQKFFRVRKP
jgi:microsomal dipeptidase-like Zn-dependent dipeptidase